MSDNHGFCSTYSEARSAFIAACESEELEVRGYVNPGVLGVDGEKLFTDVAFAGRRNAPNVLVLLSGTHGIEGYCGSGVQIELLRSGIVQQLRPDVGVLLVHAINPHGFSHGRRVNEDNIDLNRNFVDFSSPVPQNPSYSKLHPHLVPEHWDKITRAKAHAGLMSFVEVEGEERFSEALAGGQYSHSDGLFYGGKAASWSRTNLESILRDYLVNAAQVAFIDVHTGLGPYGYGELIALGSEQQKRRTSEFYEGETTDPDEGSSTSVPILGTVGHGVESILGDSKITFVALEYGTQSPMEVMEALRADNWLYNRLPESEQYRTAIKRQIREAFYIEAEDWKGMVWDRAREVVGRTLHGLSDQRDVPRKCAAG